jgi:hypothetical protein
MDKKQAMYREQALQSYKRPNWQGIQLPRLFSSRSIVLQWLCWLIILVIGVRVSMMPITVVIDPHQPQQWNVTTQGDTKILSFSSPEFSLSNVMIATHIGSGWVKTQILNPHEDRQSVVILDKKWEQPDKLILRLEHSTSLWDEVTSILRRKGDS